MHFFKLSFSQQIKENCKINYEKIDFVNFLQTHEFFFNFRSAQLRLSKSKSSSTQRSQKNREFLLNACSHAFQKKNNKILVMRRFYVNLFL